MRLDHLLSKEHLDLFGGSRTQYHTDCVWLGLKGGTFDMASAQLGSTSTPHSSGCGWRVGSGERGVGTLLGPEGPDAALAALLGWWVWGSLLMGLLILHLCGGGVGGYRPYFENYTVDASIFKMILRDCSCYR